MVGNSRPKPHDHATSMENGLKFSVYYACTFLPTATTTATACSASH